MSNYSVSQETDPITTIPHVTFVPLSRLQPNPYQPRQHYDPRGIVELAINIYSMKSSFPQTRGLQQIPMARPVFAIGGKTMPWTKEMDPFRLGPAGNGFQLHFGHRRWMAFRLLYGIHSDLLFPDYKIPAELSALLPSAPDSDYGSMPILFAYADDQQMWQAAMSENANRKDISVIEEAAALQRAVTEFGLSVEEAGQRAGYARSTTANKIRLLELPAAVQTEIVAGNLTERHGRELLRLVSDTDLCVQTARIAIEKAQTVAVLKGIVDNHARTLEEQQRKARELDAVRAVLEAGYCLPGQTDPLPVACLRPEVEGHQLHEFGNTGSDLTILKNGLCGPHCECLAVAYNQWRGGNESTLRPDPANAPHVCVGCTNYANKRQKVELVQRSLAQQTANARAVAYSPQPVTVEMKVSTTTTVAAEPAIHIDETLLAEERKRTEAAAAVAAINAEAERTWAEAVAGLDLNQLWNSLTFWRILGRNSHRLHWHVEEASSLADLQQNMLDAMFQETKRWTDGNQQHDLNQVTRLITRLTQPATAWAAGWTEKDEANYTDLIENEEGHAGILDCLNDLEQCELDAMARVIQRFSEECEDAELRQQFVAIYQSCEGA